MVAATQTTRFLPFLEPAEESTVLATAPIKSFDRGQLVLDQNVLLRAIFLIEEGAVRVERRDRDQTIPLALLEAGEFFGEMSYVDGAPTSAMVIADVPTRLRVIDEATVNNLTKKDPALLGPSLSLDCGHPRGTAAAHLDAPRLPDRRHRLLQPDAGRDRGRRCQAARAGLATGSGGGCGGPRAQALSPRSSAFTSRRTQLSAGGSPAHQHRRRGREPSLGRQ